MKLTGPERIVLQTSLPIRGNYILMVAVKEIKEKVALTDQERTDLKVVVMDGRVEWSEEANDYEVDFEFAKTHLAIIDEALQKISKDNEMTENHLTLYQKFCLEVKTNPMKIVGDE